jgi:hypothetical protein
MRKFETKVQQVKAHHASANAGGVNVLQKKAVSVIQKLSAEEGALQDKSLQKNGIMNATAQLQENKTGMPDNLKAGIENLSGMRMDHVKVHYNSSQPAQLNAHAYAQGSDIHIAPGQEKHLPHEAWHVVQQAQGRVQPTKQMKQSVAVNDDPGLEHEADVMGALAMNKGTEVAQSKTLQAKSVHANTVVQRQILHEQGFSKYFNLAERCINKRPELGSSPPTVNGKAIFAVNDFLSGFKGYEQMVNVFQTGDEAFTAIVGTVPTNNMGYMMNLPAPGPWVAEGAIDIADLLMYYQMPTLILEEEWNKSSEEKKKAREDENYKPNFKNIHLQVTGPNGDDVLADQIEKHESKHAEDNLTVRDKIIKPWDRRIQELKNAQTPFSGKTKEEAKGKLFAAAGGSLEEIAAIAIHEWGRLAKDYHNSKKGKTVLAEEKTIISEDRSKVVFFYYLTA